MALKRSMLKSMGLEEEQITTIIEAHTEVVNSLKSELEKAEENTEELKKAQKEIKKLQGQVADFEEAQGNEAKWKEKYDTLKKDYDGYKEEQEAVATLDSKKKAFKGLLNKANIAESAHDSILNVTKFDDLSLGEDGNFEDSDSVLKGIQEQWKGFVKQVSVEGAKTPNPENSGGQPMTREEISKIKDTSERQAAYAKMLEAESKGE